MNQEEFETNVSMNPKRTKQASKKVLRKIDVSGRLSSYHKMKQKHEASIRQLTDDIITLVEEKDIMKVTTVKMKWRMRLDIEKAVWIGNVNCH